MLHQQKEYINVNILRPNLQGLVQALHSYEEISYPYPYIFLSKSNVGLFKQTAGKHPVSQLFSC